MDYDTVKAWRKWWSSHIKAIAKREEAMKAEQVSHTLFLELADLLGTRSRTIVMSGDKDGVRLSLGSHSIDIDLLEKVTDETI